MSVTAGHLPLRDLAALQLPDRPPLNAEQAAELSSLFKVLASDSRLRLLHALDRAGEHDAGRGEERPPCVTRLLELGLCLTEQAPCFVREGRQ